MRSRFYIQDTNDETVWIVDLANECGTMSVTNDAENVVANIAKSYGNRRIFYKDTDGQCGELVHDKGRFLCFGDAVGW